MGVPGPIDVKLVVEGMEGRFAEFIAVNYKKIGVVDRRSVSLMDGELSDSKLPIDVRGCRAVPTTV